MRSILRFAGALAIALCLQAQTPTAKPKLLVAIAIDQFRYDYLTRFRSEYKGGLARMLEKGAVFTNAHYEHFPTVTAIGHATFLTGSTPSVSGIVGNEWFDRDAGKQVSSVSDEGSVLIGIASPTPRRGSSPHRLLVSTIADELKMANQKSKSIGISSKDRSAILPAGRMADMCFWFDTSTGMFVSSTYYAQTLPAWAEKFNQSRIADQYLNKSWSAVAAEGESKPFFSMGDVANSKYWNAVDRSPFGNDLLLQFTKAAVEGESLGADDVLDVLTVSFSANDRIGHQVGPDAPEVRDISIQTDRTLGQLFEYLDKQVGPNNYVAVLTADHGVAPLPEVMQRRKMPGGRIPEGSVLNAVQTALDTKYGKGQWVIGKSGPSPYLNYVLLRQRKIDITEAQQVAAAAVRALPNIQRVYTKADLEAGRVGGDPIDKKIIAGFHAGRATDIFVISEPYFLFEASGTSHGTPYNYDSHVPVIFMGPGIKPGRYHQRAAVNDIAPTLATLLEVATPSGSVGRPLHEMLQ